jgi:hypothetical protein
MRNIPQLLANVRIIRTVRRHDSEHSDRIRVSRIVPLASEIESISRAAPLADYFLSIGPVRVALRYSSNLH